MNIAAKRKPHECMCTFLCHLHNGHDAVPFIKDLLFQHVAAVDAHLFKLQDFGPTRARNKRMRITLTPKRIFALMKRSTGSATFDLQHDESKLNR